MKEQENKHYKTNDKTEATYSFFNFIMHKNNVRFISSLTILRSNKLKNVSPETLDQ